jgi:hypothetical protein
MALFLMQCDRDGAPERGGFAGGGAAGAGDCAVLQAGGSHPKFADWKLPGNKQTVCCLTVIRPWPANQFLGDKQSATHIMSDYVRSGSQLR